MCWSPEVYSVYGIMVICIEPLKLCETIWCRIIRTLTRKFCEELIACFPLIQHRPHKKEHFQQFFVAVGMTSLSCCLAMIGRCTDRPTDTRVEQFFYSCMYLLPWEYVYKAVAYIYMRVCVQIRAHTHTQIVFYCIHKYAYQHWI
jgi:hypothetical protein